MQAVCRVSMSPIKFLYAQQVCKSRSRDGELKAVGSVQTKWKIFNVVKALKLISHQECQHGVMLRNRNDKSARSFMPHHHQVTVNQGRCS